MRKKTAMLFFAAIVALATFAASPAQAREPQTLRAKCTQEVGAPSPDGTSRGECAQSGRAWGPTVPDGT